MMGTEPDHKKIEARARHLMEALPFKKPWKGYWYLRLGNTNFYYGVISGEWFGGVKVLPHEVYRNSSSFEEVLDSLEPELQTEMLFHLDLFR